MAIRKNRDLGFVDMMVGGGRRTAALLDRLDAATPWDKLARPIAALAEYTNTGPGRPAWSPAVMLKCLMLAKWFNLSDPGFEAPPPVPPGSPSATTRPMRPPSFASASACARRRSTSRSSTRSSSSLIRRDFLCVRGRWSMRRSSSNPGAGRAATARAPAIPMPASPRSTAKHTTGTRATSRSISQASSPTTASPRPRNTTAVRSTI